MKGYLKNQTATAQAFAGGWFHSGDLGVLHPDGYIQLKDRSKDIIISGGENISSIEVEEVIYKHPAVAACAVVGKAHEKWGETPVAFVELKSGMTYLAFRETIDLMTWVGAFVIFASALYITRREAKLARERAKVRAQEATELGGP